MAIEDVAVDFLSTNRPIFRLQQIKAKVEETAGLEVDHQLVSRVLRKDLHMGYRLARTVPI